MRSVFHSALRILHSALVLLFGVPAFVAAQAVPRADTPPGGAVRITFAPLFELWDRQFFGSRLVSLGAPLTGDTVADVYLPAVAELEQDTRTAGQLPGFVASLGRSLFSLRQERRTTPITAEFGITGRLALGVTVPVVRVFTRVHLAIDTAGSNLGLNPLISNPATSGTYQAFFAEFDGSLSQLEQNIANGSYGCPGSPQCSQATAFLQEARGVRDALGRASDTPFLPRADSEGGTGIDANITRIQQELAGTYGVGGFAQSFLLPTDPIDEQSIVLALSGRSPGFEVQPFGSTPRHLRFWPGDAEVGARYRVVAGKSYTATVGMLVRLPTGHVDSPHDVLDIPTGDGQMDFEAQLAQEVTLAGRLWLNLYVRAGVQRAGERERRLAPPTAFLVPRATLTRLRWDPGDYVAIDFAPLYRFHERFAAGFTAGIFERARDRSSFLTPQDSIDLATRLGRPVPATLADDGTAYRRIRVGATLTYVGPMLEAGVSAERTVSARGAGGTVSPVPDVTVFQIVLRLTRKIL